MSVHREESLPDDRDGADRIAWGAALLSLQTAVLDAMIRADVPALATLLAASYRFTPLSGPEQSRGQWLAELTRGSSEYHAFEILDSAVLVDGPQPVVTVRTLADATVRGVRGTWRLRMRSVVDAAGDGWILTRTVTSSW